MAKSTPITKIKKRHRSRTSGRYQPRLQTFLNRTLVSNIAIDTSQVATDTIDYVATDTDGNPAIPTHYCEN